MTRQLQCLMAHREGQARRAAAIDAEPDAGEGIVARHSAGRGGPRLAWSLPCRPCGSGPRSWRSRRSPPRGGTPLWHASAGQDSHGITHAHDHGHAGVLIHRALHPSIIRRCAAEWSSCMCTSGNGAAVSHVSQDRGQSAAGGTEALTLRWAGGPCGVHRSVGSQSPKGQQVRKLFRDVSSSEIAKQLRNGKESLLVRMVESGLLPQTKYPNRYKGV